MRAGNRLISWRTGGAVLVAVALCWPILRADEPIPPIVNPPKSPPGLAQQGAGLPTAPAPAPDNWKPRSRAGPQSTTPPPQPAANDTWKPRVRADSPVAPARLQGQVERTDSVPRPGPALDEEPETIRTMPTPVGQTIENRAVLLSAARNAVKQGNYDLAISRFEEYLRRYGDDAVVQREYAGVLFSANRLGQAVQQYQRLVNQQPENMQLRITLGDIYLANKE